MGFHLFLLKDLTGRRKDSVVGKSLIKILIKVLSLMGVDLFFFKFDKDPPWLGIRVIKIKDLSLMGSDLFFLQI